VWHADKRKKSELAWFPCDVGDGEAMVCHKKGTQFVSKEKRKQSPVWPGGCEKDWAVTGVKVNPPQPALLGKKKKKKKGRFFQYRILGQPWGPQRKEANIYKGGTTAPQKKGKGRILLEGGALGFKKKKNNWCNPQGEKNEKAGKKLAKKRGETHETPRTTYPSKSRQREKKIVCQETTKDSSDKLFVGGRGSGSQSARKKKKKKAPQVSQCAADAKTEKKNPNKLRHGKAGRQMKRKKKQKRGGVLDQRGHYPLEKKS